MSVDHRSSRSPDDRLSSCEFHLLALWEARQRASAQPERYKQIAAELRVLICRHGRNKPLLLDLMKEFGVEGRVVPKERRVLMTGWRDDPEYLQAYSGLSNPPALATDLVRELHSAMPPGPPVMFDDYLDRGCAIGNEHGEYSYKELILAVSQQIGSGHEDATVERLLATLGGTSWTSRPEFLGPLLDVAQHCLGLGASLFQHLASIERYAPRYLSIRKDATHWHVSYPGAGDA